MDQIAFSYVHHRRDSNIYLPWAQPDSTGTHHKKVLACSSFLAIKGHAKNIILIPRFAVRLTLTAASLA
jgi:hypothetical protein